MRAALKKTFRTSQFALLVLLAGTALLFGIVNPQILTLANLYALIRASLVPAVFALSIMLVMVQGGIDMSFGMIGAFSSYVVLFILTENGIFEVPLIAVFLFAVVIAVALQLFNWVMVDKLGLQPFITTLGTQTMLKGLLLAFISTDYIYTYPASVAAFGTTYIHSATYESGTSSQLHVSVLIVAALYVLVHLLLQHTNVGRQMYAVGGDVDAARRAGINVSRVRFLVFLLAGVICGIGGVMHDAIARAMPIPSDLVGKELQSIAAVVLGMGASKQARGSVPGTLLGVLLLQFITGNLIMLGIPSYYQQAVSGVIIFVGLIAQMRRRGGKPGKGELK